MKQLQKIEKKTKPSQIDKGKIESLCKAFEIFSNETARLEAAYNALREQFKLLNIELNNSNHQLQTKVLELDTITKYLNSILDNLKQGILFIDLNGIVKTYNRAAENLLSFPSSQVLFQSFWNHFNDDLFGFSLQEALKKRQTHTLSCVSLTTPNHLHNEMDIVTTFVLSEGNDQEEAQMASPIPTQGMIIMLSDVTEIHHLQILTAHSNRMKELGEMAAQLAHEIRNPLGGIKGFASLLKRDLAAHPRLQQMASYIVEGTDSLSHLMSQVLQFSRPIQPCLVESNLIPLLHEVKQHVIADPGIQKKDIKIQIQSAAEELIFPIDSLLFKSALLNLVVNGIQAMPQGGTIVINIQKKQGYLLLLVSDTGIGIPKKHLPKIFSPYFTTKSEGTGLGLAEVHKVVQAHGGAIEVNSTEGQGTTFSIKLPLRGHKIC